METINFPIGIILYVSHLYMHIQKYNFPILDIFLLALANSNWFPDYVNEYIIITKFITLHKYINVQYAKTNFSTDSC